MTSKFKCPFFLSLFICCTNMSFSLQTISFWLFVRDAIKRFPDLLKSSNVFKWQTFIVDAQTHTDIPDSSLWYPFDLPVPVNISSFSHVATWGSGQKRVVAFWANKACDWAVTDGSVEPGLCTYHVQLKLCQHVSSTYRARFTGLIQQAKCTASGRNKRWQHVKGGWNEEGKNWAPVLNKSNNRWRLRRNLEKRWETMIQWIDSINEQLGLVICFNLQFNVYRTNTEKKEDKASHWTDPTRDLMRSGKIMGTLFIGYYWQMTFFKLTSFASRWEPHNYDQLPCWSDRRFLKNTGLLKSHTTESNLSL